MTIPKIELPTEKRQRVIDPRRCPWVIYGAPGVGKTTLAAGFPDCIFLATEKKPGKLTMYDIEIPTWEHFVGSVQALLAKPRQFATVVLDTVDKLYHLASDYTCRVKDISDPGDLGHGAGWGYLNRQLAVQFSLLETGPWGLVFVSHETHREGDRKAKLERDRYDHVGPSVRAELERLVNGMAHYIVRVAWDGTKRVIRCQPSQHEVAKNLDGVLPPVIQLPPSADPTAMYNALAEPFRQAARAQRTEPAATGGAE